MQGLYYIDWVEVYSRTIAAAEGYYPVIQQ